MYGVYVHVPWCRVRCPYCAFYVVPEPGVPDWRPFVDRVRAEHDLRRAEFPGRPATVSFGGGTPSRLPPEAIGDLVRTFDAPPGAEVSLEANPEDLDDRWLAGIVDAGVTRISLGVQSFDEPTARRLGRAHTRIQAIEALGALPRLGITSWSVDLIFAVPGQSLARLDEDLSRVIDAGVPHVSVYGLTFEPGTRFERVRARGRLVPVDDDLWREMYDHLVARLAAAGIERYEVSNFARVGHRSAHNQLYWTDQPYMGLGPAAHGYAPGGDRWVNVHDLARWLTSGDPTESREQPDPVARMTDLWVSSLRCVEGIDLAHLYARTHHRPDEGTIATLARAGLVRREGTRLFLTPEGFPLCDAIVGRLTETSSAQ